MIEQRDEWEAGDRRYFSAASMLELKALNVAIETLEEVNLIPELTAALAKINDPHRDEKSHHAAGRDPNLLVTLVQCAFLGVHISA